MNIKVMNTLSNSKTEVNNTDTSHILFGTVQVLSDVLSSPDSISKKS